MPELPEVETVRRGLQPALEGVRLARVRANRPDLRFPLPERFVERLTGARVEALERRGRGAMRGGAPGGGRGRGRRRAGGGRGGGGGGRGRGWRGCGGGP